MFGRGREKVSFGSCTTKTVVKGDSSVGDLKSRVGSPMLDLNNNIVEDLLTVGLSSNKIC